MNNRTKPCDYYSKVFKNGITNGADWYPLNGGEYFIYVILKIWGITPRIYSDGWDNEKWHEQFNIWKILKLFGIFCNIGISKAYDLLND